VEGISPSSADRLFAEGTADHVIVEADGSAGRPVKSPAVHEPVVPSSATMVVAVMGLEALGRRFDAETVFRPEEVQRITGARFGCVLTAQMLSMLFLAPEGLFKGAPPSSARVAFLNKADLIRERTEACALVELLAGRTDGTKFRVVAGSILRGEYPCVRVSA
jgi:probable selenium-dependent hydroxylase accessory protein YqeC